MRLLLGFFRLIYLSVAYIVVGIYKLFVIVIRAFTTGDPVEDELKLTHEAPVEKLENPHGKAEGPGMDDATADEPAEGDAPPEPPARLPEQGQPEPPPDHVPEEDDAESDDLPYHLPASLDEDKPDADDRD